MPEEGISLLPHEALLSLEEMAEVASIAARFFGIEKIRLTGGEPLLRRNLETLIKSLAAIPGISDIGMTTNGVLLSEFAPKLKQAGLHRVNVSLDTLDEARFKAVTRSGEGVFEKVLQGIDAAIKAGLTPVKLNCVIQKDEISKRDAQRVKAYGQAKGLEVRFIELMDLKQGVFSVVQGGSGGDCAHCNRLRLLSNGDIKPCLFSDLAFNVRTLGVHEALRQAIVNKPLKGGVCERQWMCSVGG